MSVRRTVCVYLCLPPTKKQRKAGNINFLSQVVAFASTDSPYLSFSPWRCFPCPWANWVANVFFWRRGSGISKRKMEKKVPGHLVFFFDFPCEMFRYASEKSCKRIKMLEFVFANKRWGFLVPFMFRGLCLTFFQPPSSRYRVDGGLRIPQRNTGLGQKWCPSSFWSDHSSMWMQSCSHGLNPSQNLDQKW